MTATNVACQPKHLCLHAVADRAHYKADGTIGGFRNKIHTIDSWPGVIMGRGNSDLIEWLSAQIADYFDSFDGCVDEIEDLFPEALEWAPIPDEEKRGVELIVAGLSEKRNAPESYVIHATDELAPGAKEALEAQIKLGCNSVIPRRGVLTKLPGLVAGPVCTPEMVLAANYGGIDLADDPANVIAGLRLIIEMQRHDVFPGTDGRHVIGGGADVVTVSPRGISRATLTRWPEDKTGEKINPAPVNWGEWRAKNRALIGRWKHEGESVAFVNSDLSQQMISMLGQLASVDQIVKAKEDALDAAWFRSKISVGGYRDAILDLTRVQAEYSKISTMAQMGRTDFNPLAEAQKETALEVKALNIPLDQQNNVLQTNINKWKSLAEQAQVAGSKFPNLTQLGLDAGNLNKQIDQLATNGLECIAGDLSDMAVSA